MKEKVQNKQWKLYIEYDNQKVKNKQCLCFFPTATIQKKDMIKTIVTKWKMKTIKEKQQEDDEIIY